MIEIWKDIVGYEGYQVSNLGRVKCLTTNKILNQYDRNQKGYKAVYLKTNNSFKIFAVHRLVAIHFIPNPNNYPVVNHKDCNPANNCVDNLEWCTVQYNNTYGSAIQKRISSMRKNKEMRRKFGF